MAVTAHRNPIGTIVRVLMALNGIDHTGELAGPMKVSPPTVSRRLAGHGAWTTDEIGGLAEFFGVPISTFFKDPDDVREAVIDGFLRAVTSEASSAQLTIWDAVDNSNPTGRDEVFCVHPRGDDFSSEVVYSAGALSLSGSQAA